MKMRVGKYRASDYWAYLGMVWTVVGYVGYTDPEGVGMFILAVLPITLHCLATLWCSRSVRSVGAPGV